MVPKSSGSLSQRRNCEREIRSWGHPVERKNLRQVVLRITAYADKLLAGLEDLDWPDSTKRQQKAWIGRSEGAEVQFPIEGKGEKLEVYTTRPDTLFGATYMVVAPEHPLLGKLVVFEKAEEVKAYVEAAAKRVIWTGPISPRINPESLPEVTASIQ